MINFTPSIPLDHDPLYDETSTTHHNALILTSSSAHDLLRAEQEYGRSVIYIPRVSERNRPTGRSRTLTTRTMFQWPGYVFLHSHYMSDTIMRDLTYRFSIHHMVPTGPTYIPVSQLQPSRHLERSSITRCEEPQTKPSPRPLPSPGDLVSVQAGPWTAFQGTVIEVRMGMVIVDVPNSPISVRADPSAVTILDRKKVLAH